MFQVVQRSKLFTLLVALALWEFTEKAIYICLSVTISIVTSIRFFSKRDSAEILVLFHSDSHLLFSVMKKFKTSNSSNFYSSESFLWKKCVEPNSLQSFFCFFPNCRDFNVFSLQKFFGLNETFFRNIRETHTFFDFYVNLFNMVVKCSPIHYLLQMTKNVEKRIHWLHIFPSIPQVVLKLLRKLKTFS